jgi:hypothetical protein
MTITFTIRNYAQRIGNLDSKSLKDTLLHQFMGHTVSVEYTVNDKKSVVFVTVTRDGYLMNSFCSKEVDFSKIELIGS